MGEQTPLPEEGAGTPTPEEGMSTQDQTPETPEATPQEEATPEEAPGTETAPDDTPDPILQVFEEAGITGVESREQAIEKVKGLNSLVGDQTVAKQRQIVDALVKSTGMTEGQILDALQSGGNAPITPSQGGQPQTQDSPALERTIRLEADTFIDKTPEAGKVRDRLVQRMKETGLSAREVWKQDFEPLVSVGKTQGAKRLQSTTKGQPAAGGSTTDIAGKQKQIPAKEKYRGKSAAEMRADLMKSQPSGK